MKTLTLLIALVVLGGGVAAGAVATVGNVDWDAWHHTGNHQEDMKDNMFGYRFSVIHTDPQLNEIDGLYYAVSKLQIHNGKGDMVLLLTGASDEKIDYQFVPGGIVISSKSKSFLNPDSLEWSTECKAFFPHTMLERMTVTTYDNISPGTDYYNELCEKYNLSKALFYVSSHFTGGLKYHLHNKCDSDKVIDQDFNYRMVPITAYGIRLSSDDYLEVQHIDHTVDESLASIYSAENLLNYLMNKGNIRMVDSVNNAFPVLDVVWDPWQKEATGGQNNNYGKQSAYSIDHTSPLLDDGDGKYHAVSKLQIRGSDGQMVLLSGIATKDINFDITDEGILISRNGQHIIDGVPKECKAFFPGVRMQEMVVTTFADMSPGTDYYNELCERYNLSDVSFSYRCVLDYDGKRIISLYAADIQYNKNGGFSHTVNERQIDDNFDYRMESITVYGILLSGTQTLEIQHIGDTAEDCLAKTESANNLLQVLTSRMYVRIVDSVTTVSTIDNDKWNEWKDKLYEKEDNKKEDNKKHNDEHFSPLGFRYSITHSNPELNDSDGKYYATSKLEVSSHEGRMIVIIDGYSESVYDEVDGVLTLSRGDQHTTDGDVAGCKVTIPGAYVQEMTVTTYADMSEGTDYYNELCEKYGLSNVLFSYTGDLVQGVFKMSLYATDEYSEDEQRTYLGERRLIDDDFDYRIESFTTQCIHLSGTQTLEIEHIGDTAEDCLAIAESACDVLSALMSRGFIRIV